MLMLFMLDKVSSLSFSMFWYDLLDEFRYQYPYGANVDWYLDNVYHGSTNIPAGSSTSGTMTFSGLMPGTMYTVSISAYAIDQYGEPGDDLGRHETTVTTLSRPALFAWTVPKIKGDTFYVGADEWRNLMDNITRVISHAGYSYTYRTAYPYSGDILTAARYNDLRAAIQSVPGYGYYIPQVASGQIVTAQQLNLLVSELNAIP